MIDAVGGSARRLSGRFVFGPIVGIVFAAEVVLAGTAPRSRPWTIEAQLKGSARPLDATFGGYMTTGESAAALLGLGEKVPLERRVGLAVGRFAAIAAISEKAAY